MIYKYNTDTDEEKKKKMEEGTKFHKYCEDYINGKPVKVPGMDTNMFKAVKEELDKITEILNIESLVQSEKYKYAGRPDLICVYEGKLSIVDFKFTRTKYKCESSSELQLMQAAAYGQAYTEMCGKTINDYLIIFGFLNDSKVKIIRPKAKNKIAFDGLERLKKQLDPQNLQPIHLERMCWYAHLFNYERKNFDVLKNSNFLIPRAYPKYNEGIQIEKEEKEESKYTIIKTFKCCINSLLSEDRMGEIKKKFINDRVKLANRIAFDAWNFANLFVLHCLENDVFDIPDMDIIFFELCIKAVTSCSIERQSKQHPEFKTVIEKYYSHLYKTEVKKKKNVAAGNDYRVSRDDMSHIVHEIAMSMSIAAKNHLKINFFNRLSKYKKLEYLINSDDPQKSKISKYKYIANTHSPMLNNMDVDGRTNTRSLRPS